MGFNPSYSFTEYQIESAFMVYLAKNAELTRSVFLADSIEITTPEFAALHSERIGKGKANTQNQYSIECCHTQS